MPVTSRLELERLMMALEHPGEQPVSWRIQAIKKEYDAAWKEKPR